MSMNFGREQAVLRQQLTEQGTAERAAAQQAAYGDGVKCLGAAAEDVQAAAAGIVEQFPTMGRAQMTAFVRTLWSSKTHELRGVGAAILIARAELLEPHDLAFVEGLLKDGHDDDMQARLAADVLGAMVTRSKRLWKDLQRFAKSKSVALQRAAVRAAGAACGSTSGLFERFAKFAGPLTQVEDEALQRAIDEALAAAAPHDEAAVRAFADEHGRAR